MSVDLQPFPMFAILLALAGCVPVPEMGVKPVIRSAEASDAAQTLGARGDIGWPPDQWWRLAGDPQLTLLI